MCIQQHAAICAVRCQEIDVIRLIIKVLCCVMCKELKAKLCLVLVCRIDRKAGSVQDTLHLNSNHATFSVICQSPEFFNKIRCCNISFWRDFIPDNSSSTNQHFCKCRIYRHQIAAEFCFSVVFALEFNAVFRGVVDIITHIRVCRCVAEIHAACCAGDNCTASDTGVKVECFRVKFCNQHKNIHCQFFKCRWFNLFE